jgi:hypothetical protein
MIKEPMTNIVGLKALAYNLETGTFVSPARPEFIWSPGGLQMSECPKCKNEPKAECTCGLYVTFDTEIALEYINYSPISPIFLVEASGPTHIYSEGFRSKELTVHAVAPNSDDAWSKLAASQAGDYFGVSIQELETLLILMDIHNTKSNFLDSWTIRSSVLGALSIEELNDFMKQSLGKNDTD